MSRYGATRPWGGCREIGEASQGRVTGWKIEAVEHPAATTA